MALIQNPNVIVPHMMSIFLDLLIYQSKVGTIFIDIRGAIICYVCEKIVGQL